MNRRTALYVFVFVVGVTLLAALYLTLVSRTAAQGRYVQELQRELSQLQRDNAQLEVEVAREGSVSHLWKRASELGFVPAEQVEFLLVVGE